jgi:branched-chain amino acid transport system ATP-binding protein
MSDAELSVPIELLGSPSGPPALRVESMTVRYGPVLALNDFTFQAAANEITAVIGPNGSGKTTFLNALTGAVSFQAGTVAVSGEPVSKVTAQSMHELGVSRTFQNLELIDDLTVEANVRLGATSSKRANLLEALVGAPRSRRENRERTAGAGVAIETLGLSSLAHRRTSELSYGMRRRVEVARALASTPRILLLDEPTAGMGPNESLQFSELVRHLAEELSISIVLIEHDMTVIRAVCDSVYVLSTGVMIDHGPPIAVLENPEVRRVYLGDFEVHNA